MQTLFNFLVLRCLKSGRYGVKKKKEEPLHTHQNKPRTLQAPQRCIGFLEMYGKLACILEFSSTQQKLQHLFVLRFGKVVHVLEISTTRIKGDNWFRLNPCHLTLSPCAYELISQTSHARHIHGNFAHHTHLLTCSPRDPFSLGFFILFFIFQARTMKNSRVTTTTYHHHDHLQVFQCI